MSASLPAVPYGAARAAGCNAPQGPSAGRGGVGHGPGTAILPTYPEGVGQPQARACEACEARRGALFGALDAPALIGILVEIGRVALAPDQRFHARGDTGTQLYTAREGIMRFEQVASAGERRILRLAGRGTLH